MSDTEDYVITWEAPIIEKPEFRLYYDDKGYVVCYTCEKLEGQYIIIDSLTFAEGRPDVRVLDGKLVKINSAAVISKLEHSNQGILCEVEDVSIISSDDIGQYWDLKTIVL